MNVIKMKQAFTVKSSFQIKRERRTQNDVNFTSSQKSALVAENGIIIFLYFVFICAQRAVGALSPTPTLYIFFLLFPSIELDRSALCNQCTTILSTGRISRERILT